MNRLNCVLATLFGLVVVTTAPLTAAGDERSVTGAATASFAPGAEFGPVAVQGIEIGTGVYIESDGSASGTFHAALQGSSLGLPREIIVEGTVNAGSVGTDGRATITGTASLKLGDGSPPLPGVPFRVIVGADGVVLAIDSTTLPAASLTAGAVTVE